MRFCGLANVEKEFEGVTLVEVDMAKEVRSFSESGKGGLHPGLDATMCSLTEEYTFLACGKVRKRKTTFHSTHPVSLRNT